jgi:hypothetical protein
MFLWQYDLSAKWPIIFLCHIRQPGIMNILVS